MNICLHIKVQLMLESEVLCSSFNEVDGIPASANKFLMTDVLRKQWGFKGFVVTDYTAYQ